VTDPPTRRGERNESPRRPAPRPFEHPHPLLSPAAGGRNPVAVGRVCRPHAGNLLAADLAARPENWMPWNYREMLEDGAARDAGACLYLINLPRRNRAALNQAGLPNGHGAPYFAPRRLLAGPSTPRLPHTAILKRPPDPLLGNLPRTQSDPNALPDSLCPRAPVHCSPLPGTTPRYGAVLAAVPDHTPTPGQQPRSGTSMAAINQSRSGSRGSAKVVPNLAVTKNVGVATLPAACYTPSR